METEISDDHTNIISQESERSTEKIQIGTEGKKNINQVDYLIRKLIQCRLSKYRIYREKSI